ncbi:hypothetical protein AGABI1DRAFT_81195 [Agaricus bisporus var. burnettii JB137-S8]|uniref:Secreted protein n=1 Tax=Agaricus bisporus var. burnettii (strain JB137-S8 / ATCC MYA-4627 / FGSC 10392) TaxID=597362 RepID=K5X6A6_AGABU|nr:uncharacterized protein AGABI1DRAFT_81195 [Agaricus bisporus var. burnettii JB137-S8]EKM83416.1 hypothetical protein AGABI1DRAFT_81195 [Agaricus bisporus var. burnettii JB137-S8]
MQSAFFRVLCLFVGSKLEAGQPELEAFLDGSASHLASQSAFAASLTAKWCSLTDSAAFGLKATAKSKMFRADKTREPR